MLWKPTSVSPCVCLALTLACLSQTAAPQRGASAEMVNESARQIPVAYQVDVLVVGGGTGAVSAAVAAAEHGAKVFLAAPYPYLGDDVTATLRLWLEPDEKPQSPLQQRLFHIPADAALDANRLKFTYSADVPSAGVHKDTDPPSVLCDGRWGQPAKDSVQYNSDVLITADLGKAEPIKRLRVLGYHRAAVTSSGGAFDVQSILVSASQDGQSWQKLATLKPVKHQDELLTAEADVEATARYLRFEVKKPPQAERILLGELEIIGPAPPDAKPAAPARPMPRPMHVKKVLDEALLSAGVEFLYSCYVTDVLHDAQGNLCGVVMANRAGRQAVLAKTIIDATDRAIVARLAGAQFRPYPPGIHTFRRVVIGGQPRSGENMTARVVPPPFVGPFPNKAKTSSGLFQVIEYTLRLPMKDDSFASWAAADQTARTMTYHPEQQFTADALFQVPPDPMIGRDSADGPWQGVDNLPLGACQPAKIERLYVLGGCADVSRQQAEKLLRPLALMDLGARLGKAAAEQAKRLPKCAGAQLLGQTVAKPVVEADVRELLVGVRPVQQLPTIAQQARAVPVLGRYDVVVVGGGTGGAPAAIAAARQGAKTLVVEYLYGLGGVGTQGAISSYYWGNRVGFTATVPGGASWVIEQKMEWYRSEILKAGGEVWFGVIGCGALVQADRVIGAVVATPQGRGVVLAKAVVDATGNSDVAAAAGAQCLYTDETEFGMQGTGLPGRRLGETYNNTDFTIVDETDMVDMTHVFVYAKEKYPDAFDHGKLIDTRERRRIVGDFTITLLDQLNGRTYPDTVVVARSNFDTHGYTIDPYLLVEHPDRAGFNVNIPYRAMLPKGLEGLIVTGLSTSAHRDAVPLIRMQPDIQNQGYAAGVAAAMAAKANTLLRNIDLRELQKHLVEIGNLPESVLADKDSFPLPNEALAKAVETLKQGHGAAALMTDPQRAVPLLKKAYQQAQPEHRLIYAKTLAVLGDNTGMDDLLKVLTSAEKWDKGWNYRGMGQFGSALSELDTIIIALGRTGDRRALPAILEKAKLLDASVEFSHHRAVGLACELIGDRQAAPVLAEVLQKPNMMGHAHTSIEIARKRGVPGGTNAETTRRESLRELMLARALYRCGDHNGLGKQILEEYTRDLRGHLARHAKAVLEKNGR